MVGLSQCFHLSQNSGRMRTCGCPVMHALLDNDCVKCSDLFLNCSSPGTKALSALPQPGFTRLGNSIRAYQCLKPSTRCNAMEHGPKDGCEDGYSGPLCSECSPKYYASGSACKPCTFAASRSFAVRVLCFLMLVLALGTVFWRWRRSSHSVSLPQAALKELLKRQAPILLQTCGLTNQGTNNLRTSWLDVVHGWRHFVGCPECSGADKGSKKPGQSF